MSTTSRGGFRRLLHIGLLLALLLSNQPGTLASARPVSAAPVLTVSLTTVLSGDGNGNGLAEPGDTLRSTTVITNSGGDAANVAFSATLDPNTTLVPGSLRSSPLAFGQAITGTEDTPLTITLTGADPDGDTVSFTIVTPPSHGALGSIVSTGRVTATVVYTPALDYVGPDGFVFRVSDATAFDTDTISLVITATNDAPVLDLNGAVAGLGVSALFTEAGGPVLLAPVLTAADVDSANIVSATVSLAAQPDGAAEVLTATGTVSIAAGYAAGILTLSGTDTVSNYQAVLRTVSYNNTSISPTLASRAALFRASDGLAVSLPATATIVMSAVNNSPIVTDNTAGTNEDTAVVITVLADDSDPDGAMNPASVTVITAPVTGTTTVNTVTGAVTYTPSLNVNGVVTFTYQACDNGVPLPALCGAAMVTVTVSAVNDAPTFTLSPADAVAEDTGLRTVPAFATAISPGPADEASQVVTFTVTSSNPALFSAGPGLSASGTLTYTPAANAYGSATLTVTLMDSGGTALGGIDTSAALTATITITPVNDVPSFTKGADQSVLEDSGPQTVPGWATAISPGPNEAGQVLTFTVTGNANPALFSVGPAVAANGDLSFTPAANLFGSAVISLTLSDDGGTALGGVDTSPVQVFTITVTSVNDPPTFTAGPDLTALEDSGLQTVTGWATAIVAGPSDEAGQVLTFTVSSNSNPALFSAGPGIASNGTLTYTPALNANGSAIVVFTLKDSGGTGGGGSDTSAPVTVTFTITPVNDAPSFAAGPNVTVVEDSGPYSAAWATSISAGPTDEIGQALSFVIQSVISTTPGLFAASPSIAPDGTLSFTPGISQTGFATVTVVLTDSGGTLNLGVDTSAPAVFRITVRPPNFPPVANAVSVATNEDTAKVITLSGSDVDDASITFAIVAGPAQGTLGPIVQTGSYTATVTYTPSLNATGPDSFTYKANDTKDDSPSATVSIVITAVNDAPVLDLDSSVGGTGFAATFTEDAGAVAIVSTANLTVSDVDSTNLVSATVRITNLQDGVSEVLTASATGGIAVAFTPGSGLLALTGTDTYTNYQTVLRTVTYNNTSQNPGTIARIVSFVASDGITLSSPVTATVTIVAVNDAPSFDLNGGSGGIDILATFIEDSGGVVIGPSLVVSDVDNVNITSAVITLTNPVSPTLESLSATGSGGVTVNAYNNGTGVLSLSGSATLAAYQTVLRSLKYDYNSQVPTALPDRIVRFTVNDGSLSSPTAVATITVVPVNDAPTVSPAPSFNGAIGNTLFTVGNPAPSCAGEPCVQVTGSLLTGAADPDGPSAPVVAAATFSSTGGGYVQTFTDGSFLYRPATTTVSSDTFTYQVTDSVSTSNVIATINFTGEQVWYVDNTAPAGGDGRSNAPFQTLSAASTPAGNNDWIFVYAGSGTTTGGLTMKPGQKLQGQGAALVVSGVTLVPAGSTPTIGVNVSAAVTLSNTTSVRAVNISGSGTNGILGSSLTQPVTLTAVVINLTGGTGLNIQGTSAAVVNASGTNSIATSSGKALDLDGVTAAATFSSVSSTGSSTQGIRLNNLAGSLTMSGGSVSTPTGNAFEVAGNSSSAAVSYSGNISQAAANRVVSIAGASNGSVTLSGNLSCNSSCSGVLVQNRTGGTITFSGGTKTLNTSVNPAVTLTNNAGAAIDFTGGGLDIDTTSGAGFSASGGGTISVQGAGNTIFANGSGIALSVVNTTISASNLTFQSISAGTSSSTAGNGMTLDTTGSIGGLIVTGDGTNTSLGGNSSGGIIQNKTGPDGSASSGNGIYLNNTAKVSLSRMDLHDFGNRGIFGLSVTDFTLRYSKIGGIIGTTSGSNDLNLEVPIEFGISIPSGSNGLFGTSLIDNVTITGGIQHNVEVHQQSGAFILTVSNSNIHDNSTALGSDGINMELSGTANGTLTVNNTTFKNNKSQAMQIVALQQSTMAVTINQNTVTRDLAVPANEGIVVEKSGDADVTAFITNNTFTNINGANLYVGQVAGSGNTGSILRATITGNQMTVLTPTNRTLISFLSSAPGHTPESRLLIDNNVINTTSDPVNGLSEPLFVSTPDGNTSPLIHATVSNNTVNITDPAQTALRGIVVQATQVGAVLHADVRGNDVNYSAGEGSGVSGIRVRQVTSATVDLEPGAALNSDPATVVLATNNPSSTTQIVGTVTNSMSNSSAKLPSDPLLFQPSPLPPSGAATGDESAAVVANHGALGQAELQTIVAAAITRWMAAGLNDGEIARLRSATFGVAELPSGYLGATSGRRVLLARDASNAGWFIDTTPLDDEEFAVDGRHLRAHQGAAAVGVDVLSVVLHEMGHLLGRSDDEGSDVMAERLPVGIRRVPPSSPVVVASAIAPASEPVSNAANIIVPSGSGPFESAASASVVAAGGTISLPIGLLPAGKRITVTFDVTVNNPLPLGVNQATNQVDVSGDGFTTITLSTTTALTNNPPADLQVSLTNNRTTLVPGTTVTYTMVVTNSGPVAVANAPVTATFPAILSGVVWTCQGLGGGTCGAANGTGGIVSTVSLAAGQSARFTAIGTLPPGATGTVTASAAVAVPFGMVDPVPGNNTALDVDPLTPQANVVVTTQFSPPVPQPGTPVTYTLTAVNLGPSAVNGVVLVGNFSPAIEDATASCQASGGAVCGSSTTRVALVNQGSNLTTVRWTVDLPVGGKAVVTVVGNAPSSPFASPTGGGGVELPPGTTPPTDPGGTPGGGPGTPTTPGTGATVYRIFTPYAVPNGAPFVPR